MSWFPVGRHLPQQALFLLLLFGCWPIEAWQPGMTRQRTALWSSFKVSTAEMDAALSAEEKTVVSVVRNCGPSVGFVTSVQPTNNNNNDARRNRRNGSRRNNNQRNKNLPPGRALGSGSCFVVDTKTASNTTTTTYLATNYHVIEQAYRGQQRLRQQQELWTNLTSAVMGIIPPNNLSTSLLPDCPLGTTTAMATPEPPAVYVRLQSATRYEPCRIVDVDPSLDLAVLAMNTTSGSMIATKLPFGDSSSLLVGQSLIAIGNPFGLDNTVTTGVVSALDREVTTSSGSSPLTPSNVIRNAIQTDCAINPGNSGGPLLNRQGQVVGMNTAIVTTSGSSAGIGFAVPADAQRPVVERILRRDGRRRQAFLGVATVVQSRAATRPQNRLGEYAHWIARVQPDSPAARAGMRPLQWDRTTGAMQSGDAIVAINSQTLMQPLAQALEKCRPNEQIAVTLEDYCTRERRVVYVTLE